MKRIGIASLGIALAAASMLALGSCGGLGLPSEKQVMKDLVGQELVYAYDNTDWRSMLNGGSKVTFKDGQITKLSILKDKTSSDSKAGVLTYYANLEADLGGSRISGEVQIDYRKMDQGWKVQGLKSVDQVNSYSKFTMLVHNENGIDEGM